MKPHRSRPLSPLQSTREPVNPPSLIRLVLCGSLALTAAASAAVSTWNGASGIDANWSTAGNWGGIAPAPGDDLVFGGFNETTNHNDLDTATAGTFAVNSISFDPGASFFSLGGNTVNLSGKTITNNSDVSQEITFNIEANTGFTIDTTDLGSEVFLTGSINTTAGFNQPIHKNGSGTVVFNGVQNTSWALNVNAGTMVVFNANNGGQVLGFSGNIAAGAKVITESNDVFHNGSRVQLNGTLDLGGSEEQLGTIYGTGTVTNHGDGTGVTLLRLNRYGSNNGTDSAPAYIWSGTIEDGTEPTAIRIEGARSRTVTFAGTNTYTGNTTITSATESFILADTGSLVFKPTANGLGTSVNATLAQTTGSVSFNGTFNIDLSEAEMIHNNSWLLVGATLLNESYGSGFNVAAPFSETSAGVWTHTDGSNNTWSFSEATGVLTFTEPAGRPPVTTWDGGGTDDLWSTADNWDVEVLSGDDLVFTGSAGLSNTNDLDTAWDMINAVPGTVAIDSFKFDAAAGAFTLGGNEVYYDNKSILNESAATQTVNFPIRATDGLTVNTPAGDIVLGGSLGTTAGFNKPLTKTGSGKLVLNGSQSTSWALNVNAGTMQVFNPNTGGQVAGYSANIAAGATLMAESGDVFHSNSRVQVTGTLDLGANEQIGVLYGNGVVTNHGIGGLTTLFMNAQGEGDGYVWNGKIQDGTNVTAVGIEGTAGRTVRFNGSNTYTGDTTILQPTESFTLAAGASLRIKPGDNGVTNRITGAADQTGVTTLDGNLVVDLSGTAIANGNSWSIVDAANLNETYGATFNLLNSTYVPPTSYTLNAGNGEFAPYGEDGPYVSGGGDFGNSNPIDLSGVTNPAPEGVYQTERYGNSTYTLTGLGIGASYTLRLHFAEIFHNAANLRVFNVLVNGVTVLPAYDIWVAAGAKDKAVAQDIPVTSTAGGTVTIQFVTVIDNAKVSGIELIPTGGGSGSTFTEAADVWTMVDGANTWTFSETTGVLSLSTGGGGSNYSTWAAANGISGQPANGDFDKDGLTNLMEYALGKNPTTSSTPAGSFSAGTISFTKGADAIANGDVSWSIEESDDLGVTDPWAAVSSQAAGDPALTISHTLPTGKQKVFSRLRVVQP